MQGQSLTKQTAWLMMAKICAFCLAVAVPLLIVRRLSPFEYGLYKEAFQAISTAINVLPLGFGMTAYYFLPRYKERQAEVVFHVVLFCLFVGSLACLALAFFPGLLVLLFKEPSLAPYAPWVGGIIILSICGAFLEVVTVANREIRFASLCIISLQLSRTTFLLSAALFFGTVKALVVASLLQGIMQVAWLFGYLHSRFPGFWKRVDWGLLRAQFKYALPLGSVGLLYSVQNDLHNYFVSRTLGADIFAVYSVGCFDLPLIGLVSEAVASVLIIRVSELQHQNDTKEIIAVTARATRKLAAIFFPAYALLMVVAPEFITVLFTARYLPSVPVLRINLTLLAGSILFTDPIIRAYPQHLPFLVKLRILLFAVLAGALWFATTRFGMIGAVTVTVAITLLERAITAIFFLRVLGFGKSDLAAFQDLRKLAVAAAIPAFVTVLVRLGMQGMRPFVVLLVCGLVFGAVYCVAILFLRVVTPEERETALRSLAPWVPPALKNGLAKVF